MRIKEANESYPLLLQRVIAITIDSGVFTAHGSDVGAQLSAVVNNVEEEKPHHIAAGNGQQGFARHQ